MSEEDNMSVPVEPTDTIVATGTKRPGPEAITNGIKKKRQRSAPTTPKPLDVTKNPVMLLNEIRKAAQYRISASDGPVHLPHFECSVDVDEKTYSGQASTKKKAKVAAAVAALVALGINLNSEAPVDGTAETPAGEGTETSPQQKEDTGAIPQHNWYTESLLNTSVTEESDPSLQNGHSKEKVEKGKSPLQFLQEIRPGTIYTHVREDTANNIKTYVVSALVDEITFEGTGKTKKLAKRHVAQTVLVDHFNFKPTIGEDGEAIFNISSKNLEKTYGIERDVTINALYGEPVQYQILDETVKACKVSMCIEGTIIEGHGINIKKAKSNTHDNALTFLKEIGLYDKRYEEFKQRIALRKKKNSRSSSLNRKRVPAASNGAANESNPIETNTESHPNESNTNESNIETIEGST